MPNRAAAKKPTMNSDFGGKKRYFGEIRLSEKFPENLEEDRRFTFPGVFFPNKLNKFDIRLWFWRLILKFVWIRRKEWRLLVRWRVRGCRGSTETIASNLLWKPRGREEGWRFPHLDVQGAKLVDRWGGLRGGKGVQNWGWNKYFFPCPHPTGFQRDDRGPPAIWRGGDGNPLPTPRKGCPTFERSLFAWMWRSSRMSSSMTQSMDPRYRRGERGAPNKNRGHWPQSFP